jgi:hypothetical protein
LPRRFWRRLAGSAFWFALLFMLIVIAENQFVRHQVAQQVASDLRQTVDEVGGSLIHGGHWSLAQYRQTDLQATQFLVVGSDGTLIDVQGFQPGFITSAIPVREMAYDRPTNVQTSWGENWLVEAKKLVGGLVVVGMLNANALKGPGNILAEELAKFGFSLESAVKVKPRDISNFIDGYAVLDDFGDVKFAMGGMPLKVRIDLLSELHNDAMRTVRRAGREYAVWMRRVTSGPAFPTAVVLAFEDVSDTSSVLGLYTRFNLMVGSLAWVLAIIAVGVFLLAGEISRRRQEISLEEALRVGEGPTIEFKAGFVDKTLACTMAAFANTDSGNIFIGVNDRAEVVGLEVHTPKDRDIFQQKIGSLARDVVKPPLLVHPKFFDYQGKLVLRVFVPRGPAVAYMVENVPYIRDMSSVRRAGPDDLPAILRSHQRYWG